MRSQVLALVGLATFVSFAASVPFASAQVRHSRPYEGGHILGYGFDNNGGAPGCVDYACGGACYAGHTGEDFWTPFGTNILAGQTGTVVRTYNGCSNYGYRNNPCGGYCGNHVYIRHADGTYSRYCHMQLNSIVVRTGQRVSCGQRLGRSASSGSSTGPHLHFAYETSGAVRQTAFAGRCGRASTRWVQQRGYREAPGVSCGECTDGQTRGCGTATGRCERGTQRCSGGTWGSCNGSVGPRTERCDGVDDDCDGSTDEALRRRCGSDVGECVSGTEVCSAASWSECRGAVSAVPELCNDRDDDCDGAVDEEDVCEIEELVLQSPWGSLSDVDGDGRADVCAFGDGGELECHLASGHGFERSIRGPAVAPGFDDPSRYSTLRLGDLDGDGRSDACVREPDGIRCWLADGSGFDQVIRGPAAADAEGFDHASRYTTLRLADIDGDGRDDLCARWSDGFRCHRSTGSGFEEAATLDALSDAAGFDAVEHYGSLRVGDIDGDRRMDVCARDADGVVCWLGTPRGFGDAVRGPRWSDAAGFADVAYWSTIRLADVNGDGRDDLCARTPTGFVCHPGAARGFGDAIPGPRLAAADGWDEPSHFGTLRLGDIDGDGTADLCARGRGGVLCWLFSGRGFDQVVEGPALSDDGGWTEPSWFRTLRLADVDGDGRADLCARDAGGLRCWPSEGREFPIEIPGPAWAAGWDVPQRFGTIRLGGVGTPAADSVVPEPVADAMDGGCSCSSPGAPPPRGVLPLLLLLLALMTGVRPWRRR